MDRVGLLVVLGVDRPQYEAIESGASNSAASPPRGVNIKG